MAVAQVAYDPTQSSNLNDQNAQFRVGDEFEMADGKTYIYVRFDNGAGNVASANGGAAYWKTYASGIVTSDKTDSEVGATIPLGCAGIFQGVVTDQYYTWLQKRGRRTSVRLLAGDSDGAVGNKVFPPAADAPNDLDLRSEALSSISASEIPAQQVGVQMAAGASNLATVMLTII